MTGSGSLELVSTIAGACRDGDVPSARVEFLFVNRDEGESEVTDGSVAQVADEFGLRVIRTSAVGFRKEDRLAARAAAQAGDESALWQWREDFYRSYRDRLPETDLDLLLGDMWIWSRSKCRERKGLNLHPALPSGPLGKMWFEVIWDLIATEAKESGVMLHRVTPDVDRGPVATLCRYDLHVPELEVLWDDLRAAPEPQQVIARERERKRESTNPLFKALRAVGLAREMPLMLETVRAVAQGRLAFEGGQVVGDDGRAIDGGLDLSPEVERAVAKAD
jgi:folate-dependent phosphoribosylglycinamide formyltransferase PurN